MSRTPHPSLPDPLDHTLLFLSPDDVDVDIDYDDDLGTCSSRLPRFPLDKTDGSDTSAFASPSAMSPQASFTNQSTAWPQSYRQAMDIYSSVGSPSYLGSSFPDSASYKSLPFNRDSISSDKLSSLSTRFLPSKEFKDGMISYESMASVPPKYPSLKALEVPHAIPHECSLLQAIMNGINVLCGVGILSTPYALKEGGWFSLGILYMFAFVSWYTGCLLRHCLDNNAGLSTYPDIGQAAFGIPGRIIISIILYMEMYAACVEYLILEGDNLSAVFPSASLAVGTFSFTSPQVFTIITAVSVLPTVWLRDLRLLAYISAGGVTATIILVCCVFWVGTVDHVGFDKSGPLLNISTLPVSIGLFGFCFSGHAVFPNIYASLKNPAQFTKVLTVSLVVCTLMYSGVAAMGFTMFGETTVSQITLNLPDQFLASKIALWSTIVNPFTKYAISIAPVAMSLEELIPSSIYTYKGYCFSLIIRTILVISTLCVALSVPFFAYVMAFVGSLFSMLMCLILPAACFLKIVMDENKGAFPRLQKLACIAIILLGIVCAVAGTYSSLSGIIDNWHS